jgi:murein DD-endopeptidase MepM/ murein hydrolase activator NlpD
MRHCSQLFTAILILTTLVSSATGEKTAFQSISWSPRQLVTGSPCLFKVEVEASPSTLHGKWMGHEIAFVPGGPHVWYGLAGIDVEAKPGNYELELDATLTDGRLIHQQQVVLVERAKYKTEALRVPERFVKPDAETLRRIDSDKEIKKTAFAHEIPQPEWSGKFIAPIDSSISEGFGTRRTFNGNLASIHRGLDYHAKPGSPVTAANSGDVVLAQELFYEGNCVIIDHGQQFMTLYMHLSKLEVREGDKVDKGQEIGLTGATGRATGPHLHMAVRWQGAYLDPAQLWTLPLPNLPSTLSSKRGAD